MEIYETTDIFTPTKIAELTFVDREKVRDRIVDALMTPGKQLIIYGPSKSGKSTLVINKTNQVLENYIITRCYSGNTIDQILVNAFDKLEKYYTLQKISSTTKTQQGSLSASYHQIKTGIETSHAITKTTTEERIVPVQLTPQRLGEFLGEAKCCWILEDFHKLPIEEKKKLSQIMKMFMDMSNIYKELKIIATGAVDTAREVVQYDTEMATRVSEIHVPLMRGHELTSIIKKGERLLNISIDKDIIDGIVELSKGFGSTCHQLCLNMCFAEGITQTLEIKTSLEKDSFEQAIKMYVDESSDTLKSKFEKAFRMPRKQKHQNCKLITTALANAPIKGLTISEIFEIIKLVEPNYPRNSLKNYLDQLLTDKFGALLTFNSSSARYTFIEPFYHTYAHMKLGEGLSTKSETPSKPKKGRLLLKINKYDLEAVETFIRDYLDSDFETHFENIEDDLF